MVQFNQSIAQGKGPKLDHHFTKYEVTFFTIGMVVSLTILIAIKLWKSMYPYNYHQHRYRRRLARPVHVISEYDRNEHLNLPIVPLYKTKADESIDIGTFDKKGNFIPLAFIDEATNAGVIYTPADTELVPYPELAHVKSISNSLPSYYPH